MSLEFLKGLKKSETDVTKQATSYPTLSMHNDGNLYYKADGNITPLGAVVEVIILGITPKQPFVNIRTYWDKPYDPSNTEPPVCMSQNGLKPHEFAPAPQSVTCKECRWSQPGSGDKGGKTQKCRSTKIAAMVLANQPQMKPFIMHVPVTALKSLSGFIQSAQTTEVDIGGEKIALPLAVYRCQITRDHEEVNYAKPQFIFREGAYLTNEADCVYTTQLACKLDKEEELKQLTAGDVPETPQIEAPAQTTPLIQAVPQAVPQAVQPEIVTTPQVTTAAPPAVAPVQTIATQQPAPAVQPGPPVTPPAQVGAVNVEAPAIQYIQSLTHKSQLNAALDQISKWDKQTIADCLPIFVETANRLNGTTYDPNQHGSCGTTGMRSYPAIAKSGDYKKKRGVTAPAVQAPASPPAIPPTQPVGNGILGQQPTAPVAAPQPQQAVVPPATQAAAGGAEAVQRVLAGLQNLNT